MNSAMMLVRSNVKKTKAQTVSIFALILISVLLIELCLMVALDYQDGFDVLHRELNEGDVTLVMTGLGSEMAQYEKSLAEDERVEAWETSPVAVLQGAVPYGEDNSYTAFFYGISKSEADANTVQKFRYEEQSEGSGIYLPYQFRVSGNYSVGDRFLMDDNGECVLDTVVRGFFSCAMTSNMSARICGFILTDDLYETVDQTQELPTDTLSCAMTSVRLREGADCAQFEFDAASKLAGDYDGLTLLMSNNAPLVKDTVYATQVIAAAVLGVAGLIFTVVSIVLVFSNIVFFISTNMQSLGMLKAMGYRSAKLRLAILAEFAAVALLAVLSGTALSYLVFPQLNARMESITGIRYPVQFLPKPLFIALAAIMVLVLAASWIATRNIRALPPIAAIRNVNMGKKQQRSVAPVETSRLPIGLNLALKTTLLNWRQNIVVFIALFGISFGCVFCILMYQNVIEKQGPIIELANQNAHSLVNIDRGRNAELRQYLDGDDRVDSYYVYCHRGKVDVDGTVLLAVAADDCENIRNRVMVHSGHLPTADHEIAVGVLYAENADRHIGDTVTVSLGSNRAEYEITGLLQIVGAGGCDAQFSVAGYEKLAPLDSLDYLITLRDDGDIPAFNKDTARQFADAHIEDYQKYVEGTTADFMALMRFIIAGIVLICISLMAFVLYILVKKLLLRKQTEYSILKSVGYPTGALIGQTVMSFLPMVIVSLVISLPLSVLTINDVFSLFIRGLGVFRTVFQFSGWYVALAGVLTVALSLLFLFVFSLKIRRYSPRQLLTGN